MTISIRSEATGGTTTSSLVVSKPGDVQDNDLLFLIVGSQHGLLAITPPDDWFSWGKGASTSGNDTFLEVFAHFVVESDNEPASYTFVCSIEGVPVGWWVGSLSTTDLTIGLDQAISFANRQNDTSPNTPGLTTVVDNTLAFAAWAVSVDSTTTPPGAPWATRADNVGGNGVLSVSSQAFPTASTSTGTPEVTDVAANQEAETAMIVLRDNAPTAVRIEQAGAYVEILRNSVGLEQAGIYVETGGQNIRLEQVGIYVETIDRQLHIEQAGIYVEYIDVPIVAQGRSQIIIIG